MAQDRHYRMSDCSYADAGKYQRQELGAIMQLERYNIAPADTQRIEPQCNAIHDRSKLTIGVPGHKAGLFNAQYMTRMARIASMPPKAMRCRPSETLWMPLKRKMLAANERKRAKMPGLQRMRLASSAKLPSRTDWERFSMCQWSRMALAH